MTATAEHAAAADPVTAVADGGIARLNSTDGLFLRAEHLTAMQDYARELARCAGLAAGSGVVYGYGVSLSGCGTHVRAGSGDRRRWQAAAVAEGPRAVAGRPHGRSQPVLGRRADRCRPGAVGQRARLRQPLRRPVLARDDPAVEHGGRRRASTA